MSAAVKYTLARLGLFVVFFLMLLPVGQISVPLKLMLAVLASAGVSWFALRGLRDRVATQVEGAMVKRRDDKEKLRAALAGEEKPTGNDRAGNDRPAGQDKQEKSQP